MLLISAIADERREEMETKCV